MKILKQKLFSSFFTIAICICLIIFLLLVVRILNLFSLHTIIPHFHLGDILVGITIYLKTSIDFILVIGNMMKKNPSWKDGLAIQLGTSLGNGIGTLLILVIWAFFKEIPILLFLMILLASLVLLHMAQEGLYEYMQSSSTQMKSILSAPSKVLVYINRLSYPLLRFIIPTTKNPIATQKLFWPLFVISFSIPFILGLDDFAGYIPLFSLINVVGFATGVFLGHMILLLTLFLSPALTIRIIKQPLITLFGSIVFISLAIWGLLEAIQIILKFF